MASTLVAPAHAPVPGAPAGADATASPDPRRRGRRRRRAVRLLAAALLLAAGLRIDPGSIGAVVALFVLVVPFEKLMPRHRQRVRRRGLGTDLAYALSSGLLNVVGVAVAAALGLLSFAWVPGLLMRPAVQALPAWSTPVLGFLLFDLVIYWVHRANHEVAWLWRFHRVHHSTEHLDWISGFRSHPFDALLAGPPVVVLLVAGFDGELTGVLLVLQLVIGLFLHANVRWRLRPLQKLVATPEFHHWHHAGEPQAWHTNYAAFLPVWDLLFGTFRIPADRRPAFYGIDEPLPADMVGQLLDPFRRRHKGTGPSSVSGMTSAPAER